jgi:hypothetical protein
MAEAKTIATGNSVLKFIKTVPDEQKQKDAFILLDIMKKLSGFEPVMWGPGIIGFGSYHYKYASGHEGDAPLVAFSPRKTAFSLYLTCDFEKRGELLKQFGKHSTGKACIYFKKLSDVNIPVLEKMIQGSLAARKSKL